MSETAKELIATLSTLDESGSNCLGVFMFSEEWVRKIAQKARQALVEIQREEIEGILRGK